MASGDVVGLGDGVTSGVLRFGVVVEMTSNIPVFVVCAGESVTSNGVVFVVACGDSVTSNVSRLLVTVGVTSTIQVWVVAPGVAVTSNTHCFSVASV